MATRAATFTSKIRNLKDFNYRIINNLTPQPNGEDIANTLKYFSQTLLSVLKDVPSIPAESYGPKQRDSVRLSVFPNLDYTGLYHAVMNIIDLVSVIQIGQLVFGEAVLNVLGCLVPFLEHDLLDLLPYTVASTLAVFPSTVHKDIIDLMCYSLLPMTLGFDGCKEPSYASESAAAIITMVFEHTENGAFHSQIVETFMAMKKNVIKDLISIIAYGSPVARVPAAHLLFYYWPQLNPALTDRRGIHYKYCAWKPLLCQRDTCPNMRNCQATKICLNPALAIHSGDTPPPLYICSDCGDSLGSDNEYMVDLLLPVNHVSTICENKNCRSEQNIAVSTCFSMECASFNGNRPIRYCKLCHESRHNNQVEENHVYHMSITDIWSCSPELQRYLVDAIVSLLKEAQPIESKRMVEMGEEQRRLNDDDECYDVEEGGDKLLSRYGIWLMVELCRPKNDIPIEILGRLLGILFQWFDATAYLPDDNVGNALERLKPEYIYSWLQDVMKTHFEVVVSCLLPHPVEYSRVGGFWDTLATRTAQIKEGLNCFFCLVPYNIITFEIWDYVMPYWLEAIRTEIAEEDLHELKVLLSKAFDIDMCPLPFTLEKMYHFITERFADSCASVQEQALQWLQILSSLEIIIPMHLFLRMCKAGVDQINTDPEDVANDGSREGHIHSAIGSSSPREEYPAPLSPERQPHYSTGHTYIYEKESEIILPSFIMMLDMVLKQMELQESPKHLGIYNETSREVMQLLTWMLRKEWDGHHTCLSEIQKVNCEFCQNIALWHQLAAQLMEHICPRDPLKIPPKELPRVEELKQDLQNPEFQDFEKGSPGKDKVDKEPEYDVNSMPIYLQLYDTLLKSLCAVTDVDALFYLLSSYKYLVLHGECLNYTVSQYNQYIQFTLKKHLIPNLWKLLQCEHSQLSVVAVPLLVHSITLPTGADIFWKLVEDCFGYDDWRARFAAVEKVTVMARCLDTDSIRNNQVVQTSLAHAFCHLIGSVEDINAAVAQKAIMYMDTIRPAALKCLVHCLEFQFDTVINDRTMILDRMQLLSSVLPDHRILSWEFFLGRFDTLSLEAQIDLENSGDIPYPQDLTSSDRHSEHFLRKLNRARLALARTDSIRSVSLSIQGKPPYRRAVSVPLHLISKGASPPKLPLKDLSCIRQQSAPQFHLSSRMSSKLNLSSYSNMFPGGQLREFTDEESNFAALLQRAMDLEGVDRHTVYQLVALLLKFMGTYQEDPKRDNTRAQSTVLRHLNILLGYNQTEKSFSVPPYKLRCSAVFNAYLSGVPFVLDNNFKLGNTILPITLLLLQYSPSPQRYASDYQPPTYTLWYLDQYTRKSWLHAILIILYKYQISTSPVSAIIQTLVQIVTNTVDAQHHRCKTNEDGLPVPSPAVHRSKDFSKISMSDLENIQETETPPQSPCGIGTHEEKTKIHFTGGDGTVQYIKQHHDAADSSEGVLSDAECTPTSHGRVKRDSGRKVTKVRQPRKLIDYSEPDSAEEDLSSIRMKGKGKVYQLSRSPLKPIMSRDVESEDQSESPSDSSLLEKKVKPICEYSQEPHGSLVDVEMYKATGSSTTDSNREGGISEQSREAASEIESTEESEKVQTSDAESEKNHDSGDGQDQDDKIDDEEPERTTQMIKPNFRQRKSRKTGLTAVEMQNIYPEFGESCETIEESGNEPHTNSVRLSRKAVLLAKNQDGPKKTKVTKCGESSMTERCTECGVTLELYDDDTIGLCIVVLSTFIHREPALATPMLLNVLQCVSRIASSSQYSWQGESNMIMPGNSITIARQLLRCVLHQLAPNGIFPMLFQSNLEPCFLKTVAAALVDFNDLTCHAPLQFLLEGLNEKKNLPQENIMLLLNNISIYLNCVSLESSTATWPGILNQFEIFFRRLPGVLPNPCDITPVLKIIISILKVFAVGSVRAILEPFSKILSFAIQNCSFKLQHLLDMCSLCNRAFSRERDKYLLTRVVVFELVQTLKFKISIPDENLLILVQFVVLDSGGSLCPNVTSEEIGMMYNTSPQSLISYNAAECMRQHLNECIEFISDLHTLTKVKNNIKCSTRSLNEDTLGCQLKAGIAQFLALEITRGNGHDNRAITRYLPWLYHPPSAMQQGPKEFSDSIGHIRLLSWILIGSLTHTAIREGGAPISCLPIPIDASSHIADHIMVIMTGFAEQSKASVLHMSSLFHAFILCQLWTMYCESAAALHQQNSEQYDMASSMVMDFWARVTPGILQLLSHSKVLAEMVNLHFLSLMEALQECNSSVLTKLFPMWTTILFAYHSKLPGHLQVRMQVCQNWKPPHPTKDQTNFNSTVLLNWLKRSQFKLGQIEVQSSAATQFYTV